MLRASLAELDPELAGFLRGELERQRTTLDMIASENLVPRAVLEAQGSVLTNKYADGYPGRRDYDGCEWIDDVERLVVSRAKQLFGADHVNVQPYSGSSANAAILYALAKPRDGILGFDFGHGGHPTHCDEATFAGRFYRASDYHVRREDRRVDMEEVEELARRNRPAVIFAGWSCYTRHLDFARFRAIADEVGAFLVVDMAHFAGLVAAGVHPDPVPFADACTMTVHKTLGGARSGMILCRESLAERVDAAVYPGEQGCPLPHVMAGQAVTLRIASTPEFRERMERTVEGARTVAAVLAERESRTGAAVITGGTDVHQVLLDVSPSGLDGEEALGLLHEVGANANFIRIAYDPRPAPGSSGIRLGTAALTTRGFGRDEFVEVGEIVAGALAAGAGGGSRSPAGAGDGGSALKELAMRARKLLDCFPIYPHLG
jgi:glycine hydroxymethyltransferase